MVNGTLFLGAGSPSCQLVSSGKVTKETVCRSEQQNSSQDNSAGFQVNLDQLVAILIPMGDWYIIFR